MTHLWSDIDTAFIATLGMGDEALADALTSSESAGLPAIQVAPSHGKQLMLLARAMQARSVLEIGTLGGYSTIWLARGLPENGRLLSLELEPSHADVARANLTRAGLDRVVEVIVGPALHTLESIATRGLPPFDLVFIDANKDQCREYFDWAVRLSRPGTMIIVDNVVREGAVLDAHSTDARVQGIRRLFESVACDHRVDATAIQTVGEKKHDGYLLAVVKQTS